MRARSALRPDRGPRSAPRRSLLGYKGAVQLARTSQVVAVTAGILLALACAALAAELIGTNGDDRLVGTARSDVISGRGGADALLGWRGADRLRGGGGPDRVVGGAGADLLLGGAGTDRLVGGKGRDGFAMRNGAPLPSPGRDVLRARDGSVDHINCGGGRDTAYVDEEEDGVYNCERVVQP